MTAAHVTGIKKIPGKNTRRDPPYPARDPGFNPLGRGPVFEAIVFTSLLTEYFDKRLEDVGESTWRRRRIDLET